MEPTQMSGDCTQKLRIGFLHPDLGIGGAERLAVDAAVSLIRRGHHVEFFTSRHDPARCFSETRDGTIKVNVLGSFLPRSFFNSFYIIFASLRQITLTLLLLLSLAPFPIPYRPVPNLKKFDVFFVDQLSISVPLLRWFFGTRVVFYCHFPDKLLSGGWEVGLIDGIPRRKVVSPTLRSQLKEVYRYPVDTLEELTTGEADVVLANSIFTSKVYRAAFKSLKETPTVIYPGIDMSAYTELSPKEAKKTEVKLVEAPEGTRTLLSLNRFEGKKNVSLAVRSFAALRDQALVPKADFSSLRLVIGGGFDSASPDNVQTFSELKELCASLSLSFHVLSELSLKAPPPTQILFIHNFSSVQRSALLLSPSTFALLYTPENEHFGIVPVEAMACRLPVIAANSGGPTETVVDLDKSPDGNGTGYLREPIVDQWAPAIASLIKLSTEERRKIGEAGEARVKERFDLIGMGERLEVACLKAKAMGRIIMPTQVFMILLLLLAAMGRAMFAVAKNLV